MRAKRIDYRKMARVAVLVAAFAILAAQLLPFGRRTNPPVNPNHTFDKHLSVPPEIHAMMRRACMDCHSYETQWPWYSRVAPLSWMIARDVERGRKAMNLSEWALGPGRRPEIAASMLSAACVDARTGRMPRFPYSTLHAAARLKPEEIKQFCTWTQSEFTRLIDLKRKQKRNTSLQLSTAPASRAAAD